MRSNNLLEHVFECLKKYLWVWMVPMIAGLVIAGIYNKLLATKTYSARQSLILRDDLLGDSFKPSRFESQESLKSAQETILEIARKPQVIHAVLEKLGPARSWSFGIGDYPSAGVIENTQGDITLSAPNGGEFGKTEAVVLTVKTTNAERSRKFMNLLLDEIDSKLGEVRMLRLESMQDELSKASVSSLASLRAASDKLRDLEKSFGPEITTIRGLNDPQGSGGFDLKLNQIRLEQRNAAAQLASAKKQRMLLVKAEQSGGVEFVTSNELLELQPALGGIMANLSTAMAQMAINEGRYTELHPELKRSRRAVEQQKKQLFDSIGTTIKGLDSQVETLSGLDQRLQQSIASMESKLQELTEQRVPYATLEEEVKNKSEVYNDVQGRLARVKSHALSSGEVTMLTRVDQPQVSSRPDQIGATTAGMLGGALGLIFGLGLVALMAPPFIDPRGPQRPDHFNRSTSPEGAYDRTTGHQSPPQHGGRENGHVAPVAAAAPHQPVGGAETAAESRLKSVTEMQRSALKRDTQAREDEKIASESFSSSGNESSIPDSIAEHMAAIKRNASQAVSPQRRPEPPQHSTQAQSLKPESTPPVAMPHVANAASASAAQSSVSGLGLSSNANQISDSMTSASNAAAAVQAVSSPSVDSSSGLTDERSAVSSADVVAAFKKLQSSESSGGSADGGQATDSKSGITSSGNTASSSLLSKAQVASGTPAQVQSRADSSVRESERTLESPEIVVVERARSPRVPESITNGRITAESLLKSAEQKSSVVDEGGAGKSASSSDSQATTNDRFSALAHDPVKVAVPEGGITSPDDPTPQSAKQASRIPSITDYAKSLDRQMENIQSTEMAVKNAAEEGLAEKKSNVRPLDIARSIEDPVAMPVDGGDLRPEEASGGSGQINQGRSETMSELVGSMENSVAGLMRDARNSSSVFESVSSPSSGVAPSEKNPPVVTPKPREEVSSAGIPIQIKKLSDSISSFVRPADPQS